MDEKRSSGLDLIRNLKGYWPIRWKELLQFETLKEALLLAPRGVRYATVATAIVAIITLALAMSSLYYSATKLVGANGGVFRVAVIGGDMQTFNPVIDRTDAAIGRENNIAEKKINSLLYLPLYTVTTPNFLSSREDPAVQPVLLSQAPSWSDSAAAAITDRHKRLEMKLRPELTWSNGKSITSDDVMYTFERLKEAKGSPEFREIFQNVDFQKVDDLNFALVSSVSNPSLLYKSNFSPISHEYYADKATEDLIIDKNSSNPVVTSGDYTVPPSIDNPETAKNEEVPNPVLQDGRPVLTILKRNTNSNIKKIYGESSKLDSVVVKRFDRIAEGSADQLILVDSAIAKGVDFFERNYETDTGFAPSRVTELLKLKQKQIPSNTFLTAFYNIKKSATGYLVNQSLRKYVTCNLLDYQNPETKDYLIDIPKDRRILPIEFGDFTTIDCGADYSKLLDSNYEVTSDPTTQKRVVRIAGGFPVTLDMIGFSENSLVLNDLKQYFEDTIGIPVNLVTQEHEVEQRLVDKNYHIAVLAHAVTTRDISENYSSEKRDLASIPGNDRVTQYKFNENLNAYTASNWTDKNAREQLIDFFTREIVSVNLYQYQTEYNFSPLVKNLEENLPLVVTNMMQMENKLHTLYVNTRRVF